MNHKCLKVVSASEASTECILQDRLNRDSKFDIDRMQTSVSDCSQNYIPKFGPQRCLCCLNCIYHGSIHPLRMGAAVLRESALDSSNTHDNNRDSSNKNV